MLSGAGDGGRQQLLQLVADHKARREGDHQAAREERTPPRKTRPVDPPTPPMTGRAGPRADLPAAGDTAADEWLEGAKTKDPYMNSPSLAGAMPSPTATRSRTKPTAPRTPIKAHTKPAQASTSRQAGGEKLEERRAVALEAAMRIDEDDSVAALAPGGAGGGQDLPAREVD